MNEFKNISENEQKELLKFPVYVSLLAAISDSTLDATEKESAINFSHIKTYSCDPLLISFYDAADKVFIKNMQQINKDLPVKNKERITAIKKELSLLEKIVEKLGAEYTRVMHRSMQSFTTHVSKAHHNVLLDFIFPMPIKGLTY